MAASRGPARSAALCHDAVSTQAGQGGEDAASCRASRPTSRARPSRSRFADSTMASAVHRHRRGARRRGRHAAARARSRNRDSSSRRATPTRLFELAYALAADVAACACEPQSKAERGYALLPSARRPAPVRAEDRRACAATRAPRRRFAAIIRACLHRSKAMPAACSTRRRSGMDPPDAHRRAAACARASRSPRRCMAPARVEPLRGRTALARAGSWRRRATGRVRARNAAAVLDRRSREARNAAALKPACARWRAQAAARRAERGARRARQSVRARFLRMVLAARRWQLRRRRRSPRPRRRSRTRARDVARPLLKRRHRALLALGNGPRARAPEARHAARLAAKKLRYATEFFAPLFPRKRTRAYRQGADRAAGRAGRWNDAAVARALAGELAGAGDRRPRRAFSGWAAAQAAALERGARRRVARFARAKPFWSRTQRRRAPACSNPPKSATRSPRPTYAREEPKLREALLNAQFETEPPGADPILLLISGVEGGGRGETANKLNEWMDPRHIRTYAFGPRTPEEQARPLAWRYWRALPPRGRIGIFMNAWYRRARRRARAARSERRAVRRACCRSPAARADARRRGHRAAQVLDPPVARRDQKQRLRDSQSDPQDALARHAPSTGRHCGIYSKLHDTWEHDAARDVDRRGAVVRRRRRRRPLPQPDGRQDPAEAMQQVDRGERSPRRAPSSPPAPSVIGNVALIRDLDLTQKLAEKTYERELAKWQAKARAAHAAQAVSRALAGPRVRRRRRRRQGRRHPARHGGARRAAVRHRPDRRADRGGARAPVPVAILAARPAARRHHDLRPHVVRPRAGRARRRLLQRSPTGCAPTTRSTSSRSSWSTPAPSSCKFWLQISKAEQLRRFQAREKTPFKRFKITPDDWRNRKKWDAYEQAVADMVDRTSHRNRAVDAGRGGGQALRARQDPEDDRQAARARA